MSLRRIVARKCIFFIFLLGSNGCADRMASVGLFAARVEDTLGRPLEGVRIRIFHWEGYVDNEQSISTEVTLATTTTNGLGLAFAKWNAVDLPKVDPRTNPDYAAERFIEFEKAGYIGFSTDNVWHRYTLTKELTVRDFEALATLSGVRLQAQVRELLAGQFLHPMTDTTQYWLPYANRVRTALLEYVREPRVAREAVITLSRFGFPEDIEALVAQRDAIKYEDRSTKELCDFVVQALLTPQSPDAWAFLNGCLHDPEPSGGIQTALLNGSARARRMLQEYRSDNPWLRAAVKRALDRFGNPPVAVTAETPDALVAAVKTFLSNEPAAVSSSLFVEPSGQLALAVFGPPECRCGYGATFHRVGNQWVLRRLGIDWMQ